MLVKSLGVFFLAVAAVCVAATSSVARDVAKSRISVTVYSVNDKSTEGLFTSLERIPGITGSEFINNVELGPTGVIVYSSENAEKAVGRALSGSDQAKTSSGGRIIPLGKTLPVEVQSTIHRYLDKVSYKSEVKEGFSMFFTPKMNGGKFVIDCNVEISKQTGPKTAMPNDPTQPAPIRLVNKTSRSLAQRINLHGKSGTVVLVLPGFVKNQYTVTVVSASKL